MAGSLYSLTCAVTGAERLSDSGAMVSYQWFKNGAVLSDQAMVTLSFQLLVVSDAGTFTCRATVTSSLLSGPITTSSASPINVTLSCKSLINVSLIFEEFEYKSGGCGNIEYSQEYTIYVM